MPVMMPWAMRVGSFCISDSAAGSSHELWYVVTIISKVDATQTRHACESRRVGR